MASRRVHLFIPCFVDQLYPETGVATVKLLRKAGCSPLFLREQTCCGQPSYNSGFHKETKELAEKFIRIFAEAEVVVAPSASCVAMVREHYGELELEPALRTEYESLRTRVFELSEFLVDEIGFTDVPGKFSGRVAYHASCHGYRELGIERQPKTLLAKVPGMELVGLEDRKACCGFGGTFAAKFSSLSAAMGEDKLHAIEMSGASVVTATDDSCLMHLEGMAKKRHLPIRFYHYARLLAGEVSK